MVFRLWGLFAETYFQARIFDVNSELLFFYHLRTAVEQLSNVLINVEADEHFLETMHFQLIATNEASLCKPTTNFCSLIALKLQDFAVLGMFNYSSVASKLLKKNKQINC